MAGYPIASEVALSMDRLPETCPYSVAEIEDYLFNCHCHWSLKEEPTTFKVSGPCAQKVDAERRYWLFEAIDAGQKRKWFIVVGTGRGFAGPSSKMRRWTYAETNDDDLSPDQFLDRAYREQLKEDARS
jgi:hypothetical protein